MLSAGKGLVFITGGGGGGGGDQLPYAITIAQAKAQHSMMHHDCTSAQDEIEIELHSPDFFPAEADQILPRLPYPSPPSP